MFCFQKTFTHLLGKGNCYHYLIAGGDQYVVYRDLTVSVFLCCSVLLRSSEAPEDDYQQGIEDLKKVLIEIAFALCIPTNNCDFL